MHYQIAQALPKAWSDVLAALCRAWDADKGIQRDLQRLNKRSLPDCPPPRRRAAKP